MAYRTRKSKILIAIPYFLLWCIYLLISLEKRTEYMMAKEKGCKCIGSKDTSWFIPGSETTYYFDPSKKPKREYITWREFWEYRGYLKRF